MHPARKRLAIPNFADVAKLILPNDAPLWMPGHLEWWAQGVRHDLIVDGMRSSTLKTRQRIAAFAEAARLIEKELGCPVIRSLLTAANESTEIGITPREMRLLASRADAAGQSSLLVSANGKTKRGRSKPQIPDIFDARTILADRVLEMWRFFRKTIPGLKNREIAAAAQAYWLACGGRSDGYGDPVNGWYNYFKAIKINTGSPGLKQLMWWRDLQQAARRGGPPWFLGTYYPLSEAEFRSPVPSL